MTVPDQTVPDQILRYGVIGTGMMGCEHLLTLNSLDGAKPIVAADPNPTSREWASACVPGIDVVDSLDDLLDRDDLDVIVVATPNFTHNAVLRELMAHPHHAATAVMIEKPLCTTVSACHEVLAWDAARSGVTWMGLEYRFMPTIAVLLDALAAVGTPHMVSIREHRFPFLPKVDNWNRFSANTGGTFVEKCCHFFDLMNQVTGATPVRVLASGGQSVNHLDEVYEQADGETRRADLLDNGYVVVEFDSGTRGLLDLCMFAEGAPVEQEIIVVGDKARLDATVPGDSVRVGPRGGTASVLAAPLSGAIRYAGFHHGATFREHEEFQRCLRTGAPPSVTLEDGLWSVAMGAAAHLAIAEGRAVELAEFGLPHRRGGAAG